MKPAVLIGCAVAVAAGGAVVLLYLLQGDKKKVWKGRKHRQKKKLQHIVFQKRLTKDEEKPKLPSPPPQAEPKPPDVAPPPPVDEVDPSPKLSSENVSAKVQEEDEEVVVAVEETPKFTSVFELEPPFKVTQ